MPRVLCCSWCGFPGFIPLSNKLAKCMKCGELKACDEVNLVPEDEAKDYIDHLR